MMTAVLIFYWYDCERQREKEGRDQLREREQKLECGEVACQSRGREKMSAIQCMYAEFESTTGHLKEMWGRM